MISPFVRELRRPPTAPGPLDGLRFAVKDNYAVAGVVTGLGNPTWAATHPAPATSSAHAVARLLDAGAEFVGITHMDELAYGLMGRNIHYGTPPNPAAGGRVPGGSSSGSASAVAAGLVDFALGSDTGGSVRVPSSFCGIWGLRPTHDRVSTSGLVPLAASFDTAGWFAREPSMLRRVGGVLLDGRPSAVRISILVCDDLLELADAPVQRAFEEALATLPLPVRRGTFGADLAAWGQAFRVLQGAEIRRAHGAWVKTAMQRDAAAFAPDVAARLAWCETISDADLARAREVRAQATDHYLRLVGIQCPPVAPASGLFQNGELASDHASDFTSVEPCEGVALCFPTTPSVALPLDFDGSTMDAMRERLMRLTCLAGLAGAPQITVPLTTADGLPCGLSLAAAPGADEALLELFLTGLSP